MHTCEECGCAMVRSGLPGEWVCPECGCREED